MHPALLTPEGRDALAAATALLDREPLAAVVALRARGVEPELASAAMTQATLRQRAARKFGPAAQRMYFTRAGLEQATRGAVAAARAARLAAAGATTVADLGCGIGADAVAFARAGLRVLAVEADPETAEVARANTAGLPVEVVVGDARSVDVSTVDAAFCDPARRTGTGRRVFDPDAYSPPWDFVVGLAARVPRTVLKLAPGIDHALVPAAAEAQWVSVGGEVVEACVWCGPLASVPRRATLHRDGGVFELTGPGTVDAPVGPVGRYLYDPDGAVVRARLVAELAAAVGGRLADPTIAYVYADTAVETPFARCLAVVERLPVALKRMRAAIRAHDIGRLEITKRGSALDVEKLRRDLRLSGSGGATLVLTRVAGEPAAFLCA